MIPFIEISLFITIGGKIGVGMTLALCILSAIVGAALIRQQGLKTLFSARGTLQGGGMPLQEVFDGICIAVAGALLMTPGFFTDAVGFSLLIPPVRAALRKAIIKRFEMDMDMYAGSMDFRHPPDIGIIEAEFERLEDEQDKP